MGEKIALFMIEPLATARRTLRRYSNSTDCPGPQKYHDASVSIGAGVPGLDPRVWGESIDRLPHDDPRWPAFCDQCAYAFGAGDHWQERLEREFRLPDDRIIVLSEAPVGAMWWADWPADHSRFHKARGAGPHLFVRTPGGDWDIDAPCRDNKGWERKGDVPNITVRPSIICNAYHGVITNGVLEQVEG